MNIAYEKFQQVISSVLSSTLIFQRKSSLWKMYLAKSGKSWKKYFRFFFSLSTFDFLLFLFVFVIDLFMSYFLISPQWKGLNIRINDLKMHFSKKKICFSSRAQYSSNYLMNSAISKQWGKLSSFIF